MRRALAFFFLGVLLVGAGVARAELLYQGEQTLWQDTVWQGRVVVDGILTVAPEARLEIRPGTRILLRFNDSNGDGLGESEIFVQGQILALGSRQKPILFASDRPETRPGLWGAINVMGSDRGNRLSYCVIEGATIGFHAHFGRAEVDHCVFRGNLRGLMFQDSTVTLAFSRLEGNRSGMQFRDATVFLRDIIVRQGFWGIRATYSQVDMLGILVADNRVNGISLRDSTLTARNCLIRGNRSGVYVQGGQVELSDNLVLDNSEHGILLEQTEARVLRNRISGNGRSGVRWIDASGVLADNDLTGNAEYALVNDGVSDLALGGNWWGTTDDQAVHRLVRDHEDRADRGRVTFSHPLDDNPVAVGARRWRTPVTP